MNGPAWAFLGFDIAVVVLFASGWRRRTRRDPALNQREQLLRLGIASMAITGCVLIPVVAQPGDQPQWSSINTLLIIPALVVGVKDLSDSRSSSSEV